jgi:hypothetical protein
MYKKILLGLVLVAGVFTLSGCAIENTTPTVAAPQASYQNDTAKVEATQQRVQNAVPIPQIKTSAERKNIAARATLFDNENKTTYIYLVSYGKVMAFYQVKGKVSALESYMTPLDKLVFADGTPCTRRESEGDYTAASSWEPCYAVSAPDIDGAYGENSGGIFFFTTEGAYVEWKGDYMVSDQPLKLTTPPELVREIK